MEHLRNPNHKDEDVKPTPHRDPDGPDDPRKIPDPPNRPPGQPELPPLQPPLEPNQPPNMKQV